MCPFLPKELALEAAIHVHFRPKHVCLKVSSKVIYLGIGCPLPPKVCDIEENSKAGQE